MLLSLVRLQGCKVAVLDANPLDLPAGNRHLRPMPEYLTNYITAVHGYSPGLPQLRCASTVPATPKVRLLIATLTVQRVRYSADCVVTALHKSVVEPRTGTLLVPSAIAVLGVVSLDLFSARRPQCTFLWAHGMTAANGGSRQKDSSTKRKRGRGNSSGTSSTAVDPATVASPGVSLGVLSLSRGGGGPHADQVQGYGAKGALPLVKQGLRQICSEAFGVPCLLCSQFVQLLAWTV
eukprot:COSAG02_NODE_19466_length_880_cov_1.250960_1_plen_236_part_00